MGYGRFGAALYKHYFDEIYESGRSVEALANYYVINHNGKESHTLNTS